MSHSEERKGDNSDVVVPAMDAMQLDRKYAEVRGSLKGLRKQHKKLLTAYIKHVDLLHQERERANELSSDLENLASHVQLNARLSRDNVASTLSGNANMFDKVNNFLAAPPREQGKAEMRQLLQDISLFLTAQTVFLQAGHEKLEELERQDW